MAKQRKLLDGSYRPNTKEPRQKQKTKEDAMKQAYYEGFREGRYAFTRYEPSYTGNRLNPVDHRNFYHKGGRCYYAYERGWRKGWCDKAEEIVWQEWQEKKRKDLREAGEKLQRELQQKRLQRVG